MATVYTPPPSAAEKVWTWAHEIAKESKCKVSVTFEGLTFSLTVSVDGRKPPLSKLGADVGGDSGH